MYRLPEPSSTYMPPKAGTCSPTEAKRSSVVPPVVTPALVPDRVTAASVAPSRACADGAASCVPSVISATATTSPTRPTDPTIFPPPHEAPIPVPVTTRDVPNPTCSANPPSKPPDQPLVAYTP